MIGWFEIHGQRIAERGFYEGYPPRGLLASRLFPGFTCPYDLLELHESSLISVHEPKADFLAEQQLS